MNPENHSIFTPRDDASLRAQTLRHAQEVANTQQEVPERDEPISVVRPPSHGQHLTSILEQQRVAHSQEAQQALAQQHSIHQQQAQHALMRQQALHQQQAQQALA